MRKLRKRIMTVCLSMALALSMAAPAMAAEVEPLAIFDVPTNTKVHITSKLNSSAYLNVENSAATVQADDQVGVWHNTGDDSQRWYIETVNKDNRWYRVGCFNHTDLTLNITKTAEAESDCTVYPWHSNATSDYVIKIVDESGSVIVSNTFGFVLPHYVKCMSARDINDGADVYWRAPDGSRSQLWDITKDSIIASS